MLQQTLNNLQHDISLVQLYISNSQQAGFSDMTRLLESLSIRLFQATHGLKLKNKNILHPNFPAIDLADDIKRVAVQVTTNADAAKIRHTLKKFEEHKLHSDYDKLIILGFLKRSKLKDIPSYCDVLRPADLVSELADKNDDGLAQDIVEALQQHTDFSRIHPYDDLNCLEIVLRCVDRNAIKHRMVCEGSHTEMIKGMNEITELISKGTINRRSKGKSVDDFNDQDIRTYLTDVRDIIGRITSIVNEGRQGNSDFVFIPYDRMTEIDDLKRTIIDRSNSIGTKKALNFEIKMI